MAEHTPAAGGVTILRSPPKPPAGKPKRNVYALMISIMASMTSILLGYDTGVMSGAVLYIKKDLKVTDTQIEILVGTINIYSLLGSAIAGKTSDWLGRRKTIVIASVVFFVGAVVMGFASNYAMLMAGRFIAGIGVGFALMIAPVYAAEVSPASSRGFLTSFPEVFINFGVLLGYVSNYAFKRLPLKVGWRVMLGIGAVPPAFIALGVFIMPESPRWLVMKNRTNDAKLVLEKTSDSLEEAHLRLDDIIAAVESKKNEDNLKNTNVWKEMFVHPTPTVLHITIAALGLQFFQQASGIDAVVMYSPRIYEKAGITTDDKKILASIAIGLCKTAFVLITTFMADRVGRRVLLLISSGGLVMSMLTLATALTMIDKYGTEEHKFLVPVCVISTCTAVAFFSMGMGPIAWVYSSEIFPMKLRAQGCGLGVAINRGTSGVLLMSFISLYNALTIGGTFYLFSGIGVVTWVFFYTLLPETRGRTLEDMEVVFGSFFNWRATMREVKAKEEKEKAKEQQISRV